MSIDSNASAAVGGVNVNNSYQLQDGDIIAFVNNDKTGGSYWCILTSNDLALEYTKQFCLNPEQDEKRIKI